MSWLPFDLLAEACCGEAARCGASTQQSNVRCITNPLKLGLQPFRWLGMARANAVVL
jgi:hypothetical protein